MKRVRWFPLGLALLVAACTSVAVPKAGSVKEVPSAGREPRAEIPPESPAPPASVERPRTSPEAAPLPSRIPEAAPEYRPVSPLDLESWPFGWVLDPVEALRLGISERFWSEKKQLWRQALDPSTVAPTVVRHLETLFRNAGSSDEAFRAAWHLWLACRAAALPVEARLWLDRAQELHPGPVTSLERAWDQEFRLRDDWGARALWSGLRGPWSGDDGRKARLLRQRLFLGAKDFSGVGVDGYVSTLALDRDDLWVGTWNGAVVRWSLTTDALDLILAPGKTVAPVKLLKTTGWFVYAFQDQTLLRYSKVTGSWRTFSYPPSWTGLRVQAVVADGQESLWVAYLGQGLWHWDRGEWTLVDDGGGGPFLNALAADASGGFWIGTKDRGLWSWKAGVWTAVPAEGPSPEDISVIEPSPEGNLWAVGTWGEGTWLLEGGRLRPVSSGQEYVVAAGWTDRGPVWGTLDEGLVTGSGGDRAVLGPLDGLPPGGISALVTWEGRWIWGTTGQGLGWWSENENPALLR